MTLACYGEITLDCYGEVNLHVQVHQLRFARPLEKCYLLSKGVKLPEEMSFGRGEDPSLVEYNNIDALSRLFSRFKRASTSTEQPRHRDL